MRVVLGCGDRRREGWVNVDLRPDVADVVADVRDLPFGDGEVEELVAEDVLEHVTQTEVVPTLREWARVLKAGGRLELRVPNLMKLAERLMQAESMQDDDLLTRVVRNVYGGHKFGERGMLDAHHWGWTARTLRHDLEFGGFRALRWDEGMNMTVWAVKK